MIIFNSIIERQSDAEAVASPGDSSSSQSIAIDWYLILIHLPDNSIGIWTDRPTGRWANGTDSWRLVCVAF